MRAIFIDNIIRANLAHKCALRLVVEPAAGGGYVAVLLDTAHPDDDPMFSAEGQTIQWALMNLETACRNSMVIEESL